MTRESKELLLKDLCVRLPYGIKFLRESWNYEWDQEMYVIEVLEDIDKDGYINNTKVYNVEDIKPYLRPMSSMTKEEKIEFSKLLVKRYCEEDWEGHISTSYCIEIDDVYIDDEYGIKYPSPFSMDAIDWLNAHHFDYRGLIEKGLALEAPEGMYK